MHRRPCEGREKMAMHKPKKEAFEDSNPAHTLTFDYGPPKT
jgi:hypothetical protein